MYNVECLYREIDAVSVCHRRFFCQHIDVGQIFEIDVTLPLNYYYTYVPVDKIHWTLVFFW